MPVNTGLADISNDFLLAAVVIYALAMLAYACDFAYGKKKLPAVRAATVPAMAAAEPAHDEAALVGATSAAAAGGTPPAAGAPPAASSGTAAASGGATGVIKGVPSRESVGRWVTIAVVLTSLGLAAHVSGVVLRGLSVHRLPGATCTSSSPRSRAWPSPSSSAS